VLLYLRIDGRVFYFHPKTENNKLNIYINKPTRDELLKAKQKAIFRLTAIGVITNYSIKYGDDEFSLTINKISKEKIIINLLKVILLTPSL